MSTEDFSFAETHQPDLSEVMRRLQNATIGEVSDPNLGGEGQQVVIMGGPRPEGDDGIYVNNAGTPVYDISRRFTDGFQGWQPGDVIRAYPVQRLRDAGVLCLQAVTSNWRIPAETYHLDEADQARVARIGLARMDVDLRITGPGEGFFASGYPTAIEHVNAIEPTWDGESVIEPGNTALVQGEVVSHETGSEWDEPGTLTMRLAGGSVVTLAMESYVYIKDGVIGVVHPPNPGQGDVIQVHATADPKTGTLTVTQQDKTGYIVKPSAERQAAYDAAREDVASRLAALTELEGAEFRAAYADLLHAHMDVSTFGQSRRGESLLTYNERTQLEQLRVEKFPEINGSPNPDDLILSKDNLDKLLVEGAAFGIDTLALSRWGYYDFCLKLATRQTDCTQQAEVHPYPFGVLRDRFTTAERLELCQQSLGTWLPYIEGKTVLDRGDPSFDPEQHITSDEADVVYWTVCTLGELYPEDSDAQAYVDSIRPKLSEQHRNSLDFRRDNTIF